jgi:hypothetical protein
MHEIEDLKDQLCQSTSTSSTKDDLILKLKDELLKEDDLLKKDELLKRCVEVTRRESGVAFIREPGTSIMVEVSLQNTEATRVKVQTVKKRAEQTLSIPCPPQLQEGYDCRG